jgi:hypothetical protein
MPPTNGLAATVRDAERGFMGRHKKIERTKELDRKRRRREKNLKLRAKEQKAAVKRK